MAKRIKVGAYKSVFKGLLFEIQHAQAIMPDGSKEVFERAVRTPSVMVFPFDEKGRLLLTREYRTQYRRHVWFVPTGRMDRRDETPKQAALRELREEAGVGARRITLFDDDQGGQTWHWKRYAFIATDLYASPLPKDAGESIRVVRVPLERAYRLALANEIPDRHITWLMIKLYNERRKWLPSARRKRA